MNTKAKTFSKKSIKGDLEFATLSDLTSWSDGPRSLVTRLIFVTIVITLCFISVGYKIISASISISEEVRHFAKGKSYRQEIVDRNGVPLAINLPGCSLFANPQKMIDAVEAVEKLGTAIPSLDKKKLLQEFKSNKTFVWIKRDLTSAEKEAIHNLGIPGLFFEEEQKRVYTYGNLFSHIIGYVGRDNEGLGGLEKSFDDYLLDPKQNKPLQLTLDARVQAIVSEELESTIKHFRALAGYAIIADPRDGSIIACVSKPDFNPHEPSKATEDQLLNRYSMAVQEPGSGVKTINVAISIDSGKIKITDAYDITSMRVANFNVKDFHPSKGWHSVPDIFLHSSNIGMAQMILEVGEEEYKKYLAKLGLFDKLDLEIPEKSTPLAPYTKKWSDLTMTTMSYGYAHSYSGMHFVNAVNPIVNGGYKYPLHFVKRETPPQGIQVLKKSTSDDMKKLLHLVVEKGTGRKAKVEGFDIGGKTGTANKRVGKHYVNNSRTAAFLAVVPVHDPQFVIYIMLDDPQATKETFGFTTAGWNAALTAKRVIARTMALYGISPNDKEMDEQIKQQLHVEYEIDSEA